MSDKHKELEDFENECKIMKFIDEAEMYFHENGIDLLSKIFEHNASDVSFGFIMGVNYCLRTKKLSIPKTD